MRKLFGIAAVVSLATAPFAYAKAQTGRQGVGLATATGAYGQLSSTAYNQVYVNGGGLGSGGGRETVRYEGAGGLPQGIAGMGAPYIVSANPCSLENGGSAVGGPFGVSLALSHAEHGCTVVRDAGAMNALGHKGMALIDLCKNKDSAHAFFETYGLVCPGAKDYDDYRLEDLHLGLKGRPIRAIIDPYSAKILNIGQSPILGPYLVQTQQATSNQVVAMTPLVSKGDTGFDKNQVSAVWAKRQEEAQAFERKNALQALPAVMGR